MAHSAPAQLASRVGANGPSDGVHSLGLVTSCSGNHPIDAPIATGSLRFRDCRLGVQLVRGSGPTLLRSFTGFKKLLDESTCSAAAWAINDGWHPC